MPSLQHLPRDAVPLVNVEFALRKIVVHGRVHADNLILNLAR